MLTRDEAAELRYAVAIACVTDSDITFRLYAIIERETYESQDPRLSTQQRSMGLGTAGIDEQIRKGHYLNVHFRAFDLAHEAWLEHIRQNAIVGASGVGPAGAVLDDTRPER